MGERISYQAQRRIGRAAMPADIARVDINLLVAGGASVVWPRPRINPRATRTAPVKTGF